MNETSNRDLSDVFMPKAFLVQPEDLYHTKSRIKVNDPSLAPAFSALLRHAQEALKCQPLSVSQKEGMPPSGDKHDYFSFAPYWWHNPDSKDGFPYIQHDGQINPASLGPYDKPLIETFATRTLYLAYAFYFTHDERYADAAAENIRVWFINKDTRMNPHLNFAQSIPGKASGRAFGVIEGIPFRHIVEAVGLIEHSPAWTKNDHEALTKWMNEYLTWLMTNTLPRKTRKLINNQGTYYDVQIASVALFLGKHDIAADICETTKKNRINNQIMPDGSQPEELKRTRPLTYSAYNLKGLCELALYAEKVGVDLWNFSTPDNRTIRKAADWLLPRLAGEIPFERKEAEAFYPQTYMAIFRLPAIKYQDAKYEKYWELFRERIDNLSFYNGPTEKQDTPDEQLDNLLYPRPDFTKEEMAKTESDIKELLFP